MIFNRNITSMLMLSMLVYSCQPVMKALYGIKTPKEETKASINEALLKYDIDSVYNYWVSKEGLKQIHKNFKLPRIVVFKGRYNISYDSNSNCKPQLNELFSIENNKKGTLNTAQTSNEKLPVLERFDFYTEHVKDFNMRNYTIVYHWANFLPKRNFKEMKQIIKRHENDSTQVILINVDERK